MGHAGFHDPQTTQPFKDHNPQAMSYSVSRRGVVACYHLQSALSCFHHKSFICVSFAVTQTSVVTRVASTKCLMDTNAVWTSLEWPIWNIHMRLANMTMAQTMSLSQASKTCIKSMSCARAIPPSASGYLLCENNQSEI